MQLDTCRATNKTFRDTGVYQEQTNNAKHTVVNCTKVLGEATMRHCYVWMLGALPHSLTPRVIFPPLPIHIDK